MAGLGGVGVSGLIGVRIRCWVNWKGLERKMGGLGRLDRLYMIDMINVL